MAATPTVARAQAAAHQHLRNERFAAACVSFEQALAALGDGTGDTLLRVELLAGLADARIECDRLDAASQALDAAQSASAGLAPLPAAVDAALLLGRARVQVWKRAFEAAEPLLEQALARLQEHAAVPHGAPALVAACHATLGAVLSQTGRHDAAIPAYRAAWALLDTAALRHLGKERSRVQMNVGNACWEIGDPREACRHYEAALEVLYGLVDAGNEARRTDIARICRNLGGALTSLDDFDAAVAAYRRALDLYALEIRREERSGATTTRLRSSRAATRMNLGYTLFRAGRHAEAAAQFALSLRDYRALGESAPQLRDDEARAWVNQAHLLQREGRLDAARRGYARAMRRFAELAAQGRPHLHADHANAQLGLARTLAALGRPAAAWKAGAAALATLHARTLQGRLHESRAWLKGLRGFAEALLARGESAGSAAGEAAALAGLARALAAPPARAHPVAAEQLDELHEALDAAASFHAAPGFEQAWLRHALDWIARLLGESDPAWLQQHAAALADRVEQARRCVMHNGDAALGADWFLATRGLRAQRDALAHGRDDRVQELAALLHRRGQLEGELLGQPHDTALGTPADVGRLTPLAASAGLDERAAEWRALQQRSEALREQAVQGGLLPQRLRTGAAALAQGLRAGSALVLACRPAADRIVLFALRRPGADGCFAETAEARLPPDLAAFRCEQLVAMVRHAIVGASRGHALRRAAQALPPLPATPDAPEAPAAADLAAFATATLGRLAQALAEPIETWVRRFGWHDWALVPSDDLHLLPGPPAAGAGAVYPSVGAWLRHHGEKPLAPGPVRWACAAFGAMQGETALRWVDVERRLCERLWREAGVDAVVVDSGRRRAEGIDAFVGMGHGGAPQHNPARAGLELDGGAVLTAHDLPALRTCRRVVLSCCVLGQTQEAFGEPLGFLSSAFGYDAGFGSGWLTEVPDAEACLFGVAFQHTLQRAGAAPWRTLFEATRGSIAAGRWPEGFGAWLREALPGEVADAPTGWFEAPPDSLRRLMPWAVCLGH